MDSREPKLFLPNLFLSPRILDHYHAIKKFKAKLFHKFVFKKNLKELIDFSLLLLIESFVRKSLTFESIQREISLD